MIATRIRKLNDSNVDNGAVLYWMSRDQRVKDNWALMAAQLSAIKHEQPLAVLFCLQSNFLEANKKHYKFMLEGLKEVEKDLMKLHIPFFLLQGKPEVVIPHFIKEKKIGSLISDFSPLKVKSEWTKKILEKVSVPFWEVDTHNVIPVWMASDKQEYAAHTFRPKVSEKIALYADDFIAVQKQKIEFPVKPRNQWNKIFEKLKLDKIDGYDWISSGEHAARKAMDVFLKKGIAEYHKRNDPNQNAQSGFSPYLHFGQLSAQRIVLEIFKKNPGLKFHKTLNETKDIPELEFLEELVVRRELAENYCFYNKDYDNPKGFPQWAQDTLSNHKGDPREYKYTKEELEKAQTHDPLWNAAQKEMVKTGKMHGYMRMYWAKKILEWTYDVEEAQKIAIYLNDKYELDGRDPNGYTGIAWSLGGVHDRPWTEREIFGKIRYMNYKGCKRKFDVARYIETF